MAGSRDGVLMQAGKLRHSVSIQSASEAYNTFGELIKSWSTVDTVRASIQPMTGTEGITADNEQSTITHKVTIRSYSGLTPNHRLLFGSRALYIVEMINIDERNRRMELLCKEDV